MKTNKCFSQNKYPKNFYSELPPLSELKKGASYPQAPDDETCFKIWRKYNMFDNVQRHSLRVADIATALAQKACKIGIDCDVQAVRASALLHDIAKTYCVKFGGSHALLGASWTVMETAHYGIAQGVLLHVFWPWSIPLNNTICSLPFFVLYADKRVRHDQCVSLQERFEDLFNRYGTSPSAHASILASFEQAKAIEKYLSTYLNWELHENTSDSWRMVF